MIHILTVHWKNEEWIELQTRYLRKHVNRPYRLYAFLNGIDPEAYKKDFFYISTEDIKPHAIKLNLLADIACMGAESDDDWLIFIDSDAFPIADVVEFAERNLKKYPLIAVRQDENLGEQRPHPCFCITTVGLWKQIEGDWKKGYQWQDEIGNWVSDVGGNLLGKLRENNVEWLPLLRSNTVNLHPVFFGVYGNLVYHHGAGSRPKVVGLDNAPFKKLPKVVRELLTLLRIRKFSKNKIAQKNAELGERILQEMKSDDQFYLQFTHDARQGDIG